MKRFENRSDYIEVTCKKCGSKDVDLNANECHECGIMIDTYCNTCKAEYKYHNFKQIQIVEKQEGSDGKEK